MNFIRLLICFLVLPYFLFPPQVMAAVKSEMLYQKIFDNAQKKMAFVQSKLPQGTLMLVESERGNAVEQELNNKIHELDSKSNAEIAQFKKELLKLNEEELNSMRAELQGLLNAMSDAEIASLGEFLSEHKQYTESAMEFQSAFTLNEKRRAIQSGLMNDLSIIRSVTNKKIGLASVSDLKHDLEMNRNIINAHSSQKNNGKLIKTTLLILAGVALVTWGISSAVYAGRLNRVIDKREDQLNAMKKRLENEYQVYKADLTQNELEYLTANGYIRTVCGTFQQPDSKLCNRYNYKLFTGTKFCSVSCYKNFETGKETLHEPAVCTSPFIPTDCYDHSEYLRAYDRGDADGYSRGSSDGRRDGDDDGDSDGHSDGTSRGRSDGESDGYNSGYNSGYSDGHSAGSKSFNLAWLLESEDFKRGYRDGFEQYQILFLNH